MKIQVDRRHLTPLVGLLMLLIQTVMPLASTAQEPSYDIILRGGRVFDVRPPIRINEPAVLP